MAWFLSMSTGANVSDTPSEARSPTPGAVYVADISSVSGDVVTTDTPFGQVKAINQTRQQLRAGRQTLLIYRGGKWYSRGVF